MASLINYSISSRIKGGGVVSMGLWFMLVDEKNKETRKFGLKAARPSPAKNLRREGEERKRGEAPDACPARAPLPQPTPLLLLFHFFLIRKQP